jgi:hypothetical protein
MNCRQIPQGDIGAATSLHHRLLRVPRNGLNSIWGLRRNREADERTDSVALMGSEMLSIYENE